MQRTNFCSIDNLKLLSFFTANCVNPLFFPQRRAWKFKERNFLSCGRLLSFLITFRDATTRNHIEKAQNRTTTKQILYGQTRGLTSLAFALVDPGRPSDPPYLHSVYGANFLRILALEACSW